LSVDGNRLGKGVLRAIGGECFVITPEYILRNRNGEQFNIIGYNAIQSKAKFVKSLSQNVTILRSSLPKCPTDWSEIKTQQLDEELRNAVDAKLVWIDPHGDFRQQSVDIRKIGIKEIEVIPNNGRNFSQAGLSGSLLYVNEIFSGMLLRIKNNIGILIRSDHLNNVLQSFFDKTCPRDHSEVIVGFEKRLMWSKAIKYGNWEFASIYTDESNQEEKSGCTDWRVPNELELMKLANKPGFYRMSDDQSCYWSESQKGLLFAYYVNLRKKKISWQKRSKSCAIVLVRDIQ
jgi:hypothetical protein